MKIHDRSMKHTVRLERIHLDFFTFALLTLQAGTGRTFSRSIPI